MTCTLHTSVMIDVWTLKTLIGDMFHKNLMVCANATRLLPLLSWQGLGFELLVGGTAILTSLSHSTCSTHELLYKGLAKNEGYQ